jgi:hypothetical protein
MYISKLVNTIVVSTAIGVFGPAAMAHADEGTIVGRVAHGGSDSSVRVCFNEGVDFKSGDELAVIRHTSRTTSPKTTPILESARVGVLKIDAPRDGHCASATLVSGSARWLDWVSVAAGSYTLMQGKGSWAT